MNKSKLRQDVRSLSFHMRYRFVKDKFTIEVGKGIKLLWSLPSGVDTALTKPINFRETAMRILQKIRTGKLLLARRTQVEN